MKCRQSDTERRRRHALLSGEKMLLGNDDDDDVTVAGGGNQLNRLCCWKPVFRARIQVGVTCEGSERRRKAVEVPLPRFTFQIGTHRYHLTAMVPSASIAKAGSL